MRQRDDRESTGPREAGRPARGRLAALGLILATLPLPGAAAGKSGEPAPPAVRTFDVDTHGSLVFLARTAGLAVWDLAEVDRPREVARLTVPATVLGVALDGSHAFLAAGTHGLYVLGVAEQEEEPPTLELLARFDTPGSVRQVLLRGDRALLADGRYGVRVVDVSEPARPLETARLPTRDAVRALALDGELLATAEGRAGVRLFDLRRADAPRELVALREVTSARDVAFAGDRLLVAADDEGLVVYRVDDPGRPVREATLDLGDRARFVGASATLAAVGSGGPVLRLVDFTDPTAPVRLDDVRMHRSAPARAVRIRGERAYVAMDVAGVGVVDLSDRSAPRVLLPRERRLRIEFPRAEER